VGAAAARGLLAAPIAPAILSLAEHRPLSGRDLLGALVGPFFTSGDRHRSAEAF
jgi:hypothetical protein